MFRLMFARRPVTMYVRMILLQLPYLITFRLNSTANVCKISTGLQGETAPAMVLVCFKSRPVPSCTSQCTNKLVKEYLFSLLCSNPVTGRQKFRKIAAKDSKSHTPINILPLPQMWVASTANILPSYVCLLRPSISPVVLLLKIVEALKF